MQSSSYENFNIHIPDNCEVFKTKEVLLLSSLLEHILEVGMYKTDHIHYNSNVNKMYRNKEHMSKAYLLDPYPTENVIISCSQFNPSQSTTIFSYITYYLVHMLLSTSIQKTKIREVLLQSLF